MTEYFDFGLPDLVCFALFFSWPCNLSLCNGLLPQEVLLPSMWEYAAVAGDGGRENLHKAFFWPCTCESI